MPHLEGRAFTPELSRLAMRANAFARPTAFELLAALQTQACLGLFNAFGLRLGKIHGATSDTTIHQVTFGCG